MCTTIRIQVSQKAGGETRVVLPSHASKKSGAPSKILTSVATEKYAEYITYVTYKLSTTFYQLLKKINVENFLVTLLLIARRLTV